MFNLHCLVVLGDVGQLVVDIGYSILDEYRKNVMIKAVSKIHAEQLQKVVKQSMACKKGGRV